MTHLDRLQPLPIQAWDTATERLYHPETNLFYDYVSDYAPGHRFDHLPQPEEIRDQYPNPNGWTTGMEDSTISGGVMLACICDRYAATGEESLREDAQRIYSGLKLCGSISHEPGFVEGELRPAVHVWNAVSAGGILALGGRRTTKGERVLTARCLNRVLPVSAGMFTHSAPGSARLERNW